MANVILSERNTAPADANALSGALAAWSPEQVANVTGLTPDLVPGWPRVHLRDAQPRGGGAIGASSIAAPSRRAAAVNLAQYVAGNVGQTVRFGMGIPSSDGYGAMEELIAAMNAGQIAVLLVHDANPGTRCPKPRSSPKPWPGPLKVSTRWCWTRTAAAWTCCFRRTIPGALGRSRPRAGVRGLMQPVMTPVFDTMHPGDCCFGFPPARAAPCPLRAASYERTSGKRWGAQPGPDGGQAWRDALQRGGLRRCRAQASAVGLAAEARRPHRAGLRR